MASAAIDDHAYGAAGAIVILLMWFLLSAYAILMGARGAYAADTVGE